VWLATDTLLTRQVAVKVLKPALAADPVVAERFRREAVAVAQLNHPNIVAIYDTVDEGGRQAVVMQFVPGRSLRQILDDESTLSPEMTIRIGASVGAALDAAHRAGLVHRDVKPGNIMVTPEGRVLLTDFGIAKAASGGGDSDLTSDNVMMGTAKYLSPEQVRGRRLDGRADLYSLGLVLYECLCGRVPFLGENDAATALARLQRDPTPIYRLRPTLPSGLPELIHRLLARNPDERPASGAVVQSQLERIRTQVDEDLTSPTPVPGALAPNGARARMITPPRGTPVVPGQPRSGGTSRPPASGASSRPAASGSSGRPVAGPNGPGSSGPTPRPGGTRPNQNTPSRSTRPPERRDPTPAAGLRVTGRPARQFQQRWAPSLVVVGGLVAAAVVLVVVLVGAIGGDGGSTGASATTAAGTGTAGAATTAVATGPATIVAVHSYDPNGTDGGVENEEEVPNLVDGSESTSWQTVCYSNRYMGGKGGVGVVMQLSKASRGTLDVALSSIPWAASVYAADAIPTTLAEWGGAVDQSYSTEKPSVSFDLGPRAHQYVLVLLTELGPDTGCTKAKPYRGGISELTFHPG